MDPSWGRKGEQEDESDADFDGEEEELENAKLEIETPLSANFRSGGSNMKQEDRFDVDFDGDEEFEDKEEDEELEIETPQSVKYRSSGRNVKEEDELDADFNVAEEEIEDQEEDEELEIETPESVKYCSGGRNVKEEDDDLDADFNVAEEEVEDQEEDEELEIEMPESVKYRSDGRNLKQEDEFDADFNGAEEEVEDQEEDEELETETLQPRNLSEAHGKGRKVKPAGSSRQRHEDDDDYEEEIEDEDEDFDPEVDEDDEDEEEDVEEEDDDLGDYAPTRATKVKPRNHLAKRKPAAGRQHRKRNSGSRVSKGKTRNGTSARRRRSKRRVADDYEDDEEEEDDDDFVVKDDVEEEVNYRPRKKAKVGRKTREGTAEPVGVGEAWPSVESDTSEFEFVTSEEDHAENEAPVAEPVRIKRKKGRRKRGSESDSSSDSDYVISEEELKDLGMPRPQEAVPQLPPPPARRTIAPRRVDEKGKEPEEALKQICGICLSEEQRATIQGVLNCCSHYFCFACILEWSKVESRCPLCKRRFNTITKSSVADLGLGLRNAPVRVEKRDQVYQPTEDEMRRWLDPYENVVCIECNQGGDDNLMLLCDICDSSAHTFCVGLGREVPEGNWYCGGCRSSVEGPSHAQTQERVLPRGESNMNTADSSSSSFGRSISNGVFQRPPPINVQPSLQGFDLNLSPIETPEEDKRAESHISAEPVSTPTGRHATLDRRRALNRRIRILLFRPRTATNPWQNSIQHDRSTPGAEQNQRNACTSTDVSPSCSRADFMQSQQSSSQFVQSASNLNQCTDEGGSNFREVANAKDQLIPIVKKSIKHICARSPLDQSSFTNVARRATHTILALSGIAHNKDRVVATPFPFPSHCCHACDGREPAFLMRTICSSCFNSFVGDVVSHIASMFS
uniref:PHD and RING finger domain-containing protein 1 n=3 Tax=Hordeum vulgare subsp. vulgare TaxID=112509 RepID=A0A8I6WKK4_HORVV